MLRRESSQILLFGNSVRRIGSTIWGLGVRFGPDFVFEAVGRAVPIPNARARVVTVVLGRLGLAADLHFRFGLASNSPAGFDFRLWSGLRTGLFNLEDFGRR